MSQSNKRISTAAKQQLEARSPQRIQFFSTPPETCSYLPNRLSINAVADPHLPMTTALYSQLASNGFRRSGNHLYRPNCGTCQACIPVRLPVARFTPSRNQRRCERANQDLQVREQPPLFRREYFDLYARYQRERHPGGGMDMPTPDGFMRFLTCEWSETRFVEMRLNGDLIAVVVSDQLDHGFSAVYTFFSPDFPKRSLGTFAVIWQIRQAAALGLDYVYLGYWIEACRKMRYKREFRPLEALQGRRWVNLEDPDGAADAYTSAA